MRLYTHPVGFIIIFLFYFFVYLNFLDLKCFYFDEYAKKLEFCNR